jgi:hypothetical protein
VLAESAQDAVDRLSDLVVLFLGQARPVESLGLLAEDLLKVGGKERVDRGELVPGVGSEGVQVGVGD